MNLNKKIRKFIEENYFEVYFYISLIKNFLSQNLRIYIYSKKNKLKIIKLENIKKNKSSDSIFILGCGSSINEITLEQWQEIKVNDSLGINRWPKHEHVPTYLMLEGAKKKDIGEVYYEEACLLFKTVEDKYLRTIFLLKDSDELFVDFNRFPSKLTKNMFLMMKLIYPGNNLISARKSIKKILNLKFLNNVKFPAGTRGTVTHAINFALQAGYKKIVLCGIDLQGNYFWDKNNNCPLMNNEKVHQTNDVTHSEVIVEKVILEIYINNLKKNGIDIFVSSNKSILSSKIPIYW